MVKNNILFNKKLYQSIIKVSNNLVHKKVFTKYAEILLILLICVYFLKYKIHLKKII